MSLDLGNEYEAELRRRGVPYLPEHIKRQQLHEIEQNTKLQISGAPWRQIREADAWLRLSCPRFYAHGLELEKAGLVVRTENGFDWKASEAALAITLGRLGFQEWKRLESYFTILSKPIHHISVKRQYQRICNDNANVRDLHRVTAIIDLD